MVFDKYGQYSTYLNNNINFMSLNGDSYIDSFCDISQSYYGDNKIKYNINKKFHGDANLSLLHYTPAFSLK